MNKLKNDSFRFQPVSSVYQLVVLKYFGEKYIDVEFEFLRIDGTSKKRPNISLDIWSFFNNASIMPSQIYKCKASYIADLPSP